MVAISLIAGSSVHAATPDYARSAVADDLGSQVREIANETMTSRGKKERRIATTVRIVVVAATAYRTDRDEVIGIAIQMATAASRAAPSFAEVISRSIAFVPAVSRFAGAASEVRAAAFSAARGRPYHSPGSLAKARRVPAPPRAAPMEDSSGDTAARAESAQAPEASTAPMAGEASEANAAPADAGNGPEESRTVTTTTTETTSSSEPMQGDEGTSNGSHASISSQQPLIQLGDNASLTVSADAAIKRDSNVFLAENDKVAATIYTATPGVAFNYGARSLAHADLAYSESFNRYSGNVAPNVNLATANGDFGYDDGSLKLGGGGAYQQLYQNNVGVISLTGSELIRSDVTAFDASAQTLIFSKIGAGVAATYNRVEFNSTPGLFGSHTLEVPFNLFYAITPKLDLSAGYEFDEITPDGDGTVAKGGYYNVGARGSFTSKLSGGFTVGYRTVRVPQMPQSHDLGLGANLSYEITPRTSATLQAGRDNSASAQGQVLKTASYSFGLSSDIGNQWQAGAGVTYRTVAYGQELYSFETALLAQPRTDDYWEGNFHLTYNPTRWFSTSASYILRDNRSTLPGVEFTDSVLSLDLKVHY
jgi:hypothetical protein